MRQLNLAFNDYLLRCLQYMYKITKADLIHKGRSELYIIKFIPLLAAQFALLLCRA